MNLTRGDEKKCHARIALLTKGHFPLPVTTQMGRKNFDVRKQLMIRYLMSSRKRRGDDFLCGVNFKKRYSLPEVIF